MDELASQVALFEAWLNEDRMTGGNDETHSTSLLADLVPVAHEMEVEGDPKTLEAFKSIVECLVGMPVRDSQAWGRLKAVVEQVVSGANVLPVAAQEGSKADEAPVTTQVERSVDEVPVTEPAASSVNEVEVPAQAERSVNEAPAAAASSPAPAPPALPLAGPPAVVLPPAPPLPTGGILGTPPPPPPPLPAMKGGAIPSKAAALLGLNVSAATPKHKRKRRSLFWDKVPQGPQGNKTVFTRLNPSSVALPATEMVDLFEEKEPEPKSTGDAKARSIAKAPAASPMVTLLDAKTMRNVGIVFKQFRMSPESLQAAIMAMDSTVLDADRLIALRGVAPSSTVLPALKNYEGDMSKLDEVTKFMVLTARIPRYMAKLDCFMFTQSFWHDVQSLQNQIKNVHLQLTQILDSPKLHRMLEVVLAMGNFLNEGTPNGNATGIKLSSLLKLGTVKTMDKRGSLLSFFCRWMQRTEPEVLQLREEMDPDAGMMDLSQLRGAVNAMQRGFTLVDTQIKVAEAAPVEEGDNFLSCMKQFSGDTSGTLEVLEAGLEQAEAKFQETAGFYGEDCKRLTTTELFTMINNIIRTVESGVEETKRQDEIEQRRKEKEAAATKMRATARPAGTAKEAAPTAQQALVQNAAWRRVMLAGGGDTSGSESETDDSEISDEDLQELGLSFADVRSARVVEGAMMTSNMCTKDRRRTMSAIKAMAMPPRGSKPQQTSATTPDNRKGTILASPRGPAVMYGKGGREFVAPQSASSRHLMGKAPAKSPSSIASQQGAPPKAINLAYQQSYETDKSPREMRRGREEGREVQRDGRNRTPSPKYEPNRRGQLASSSSRQFKSVTFI
ncbi:unnamed protein product [Chrysoparadoxa australica]